MTGPRERRHPQVLDAGAYTLGSLAPDERRAFEAHLGTCDECREAVEEISGVPGLLGLVPPDVAAAMSAGGHEDAEHPGDPSGEPVPTSVLGALLAAVRSQEIHERRRRWVGGLAAAAVLVLGAVVVQLSQAGDEPGPAPGSEQQLELVAAEGVEIPVKASVVLSAADWGTRIDVTCGYDGEAGATPGYGPRRAYSLVVRDVGGLVEEVATWQAEHGATVTVPGSTGTSLEDIVEVELRDGEGRALLVGST